MQHMAKCPDCYGDTYNMALHGPVLCKFCKATGYVPEALDFIWVTLHDGSAYSPATRAEYESADVIWEFNGWGQNVKTKTQFKRYPYVKPNHFRQDNPQDQYTAVLGNLIGLIDNVEGLLALKTVDNLQQSLQDLRRLQRFVKTEW